uniref:Uncharacterized protein LOC104229985 n=1 Tax=Nicotiana sylvestris TaxID=4096 RepID=A0A1U7X2B7_NICSY|nr:PREDICTED: uncharacterized protein LOC104229985 [Nicotiana sylvestris]
MTINSSSVTTPIVPTSSTDSSSSILPSHGAINPIAQASQFVTINPTSQLPIKLTGSSNFLTWKAQHEMLFLGYDLVFYIDGILPCPPAAEPNYKNWLRQDSLIRHAIMTSVDATIAPLVAMAPNVYVAWTKLTQLYANKSQTRVYGLQDSLNRLVKGTKPVAQYLNEIRALADEIAIAGSPIDSAALMIKVLSGLGPEYNEMSVVIRARDASITLEELFDKLSSHEVFLHHRQEYTAIRAQYTQRSNHQNRHSQ